MQCEIDNSVTEQVLIINELQTKGYLNQSIYCKEWWGIQNDGLQTMNVRHDGKMITSRILSASEIYQESTSQHKIYKMLLKFQWMK